MFDPNDEAKFLIDLIRYQATPELRVIAFERFKSWIGYIENYKKEDFDSAYYLLAKFSLEESLDQARMSVYQERINDALRKRLRSAVDYWEKEVDVAGVQEVDKWKKEEMQEKLEELIKTVCQRKILEHHKVTEKNTLVLSAVIGGLAGGLVAWLIGR